MTALVRTAVGDFRLADALNADALSAATITERLASPLAAVARLPRVVLPDDEVARLGRGLLLANAELTGPAVAAIDSRGQLVAILKPSGDNLWRPSPNFSQSS
jgi:tRNA U55 pseudouridine synthase TruB